MKKLRIPAKLRAALKRQNTQPVRMRAVLGKADGTIAGTQDNFVWVTDANDDETQVFNDAIPANKYGYGLPVWIERIEGSTLWRIAAIRQIYGAAPVAVGIKEHASTHTAYGNDPVWVWSDQFMPWLVAPSGLTLKVYRMSFYNGTAWEDAVTETLDLTSHKPASGARYVLVEVKADGDLVVTNGTVIAGSKFELTIADIPVPTVGRLALCGVRLYAGQTVIAKNGINKDIYDLRFSKVFGGGAGSGSTPGGADTQVQYNDGGVLAGDADFTWDKVNNFLKIATKMRFEPTGLAYVSGQAPLLYLDDYLIQFFFDEGGAQFKLGNGTDSSDGFFLQGQNAGYGVNLSTANITTAHKDIDFPNDSGELVVQDTDHLDFDVTPTGAAAVGRLRWSETDGVLEFGALGGAVNIQIGQENVIRVVNKTGGNLTDGTVCYVNDAQGNRPTVAKAKADSETTSHGLICILTEDIAKNQEGFATTFGVVRGFNTSGFVDGATLYLSAATAGELTSTKPTAPNHATAVAIALNSTVNGSIYVFPQSGWELDELHDVLIASKAAGDIIQYDAATSLWKNQPIFANVKGPTGFVDRSLSTITLSTRTLTIAPTSTSFDIYSAGVKITKTGGATCATTIPATVGLHFVYFDSTGTLQNSMTAWDIEGDGIPVCTIYWNGSAGAVGEERHSAKRNNAWHAWAHDTIGTRYESGLGQTYPTTANDGLTQIETGHIHDEDIDITTGQQKVVRLWYETGAGVWTWANGTDNGGYDRPYIWNAATSRVRYPKSDSAYALTDVGTSDYIVEWVYASTDKDRPIYIVTRSATAPHNTLGNARTETTPVVISILSPEMKLIYRWIYKGDGQYQEGTDYRTASALPGGSTASTPASQITFAPAGGIAATNVQAAIEELDAEKQPLDSDLTAIAALSPSNDDVIQRKAGAWTNRTIAQFTADLTTLAPLASPTFTGTPAAPTAAAGTNTTQIATTAFVQAAIAASPIIADMLIMTPITTSGTWALLKSTDYVYNCLFYNSSVANGDYFTVDFYLAAGTYTLCWMASKFTDRGICEMLLDNVSLGTYDYYAAALAPAKASIAGIAVSAGKHTLKCKVTNKNVSSTNYYLTFNTIAWVRTS